MAHPKRKVSRSRRNKRRSHNSVAVPTLSTCSNTGQIHRRHYAYEEEGVTYYRGKVLIDVVEKEESDQDAK